MNSFWVAVFLSVFASVAYIWTSAVRSKNALVDPQTTSSNSYFSLIILLFCLLTIPVGYWYLGNYESQEKWLQSSLQFDQIQSGKKHLTSDTDIRELLLSLRTAIQQEPDNGQLWFMLAESYFQLSMVDLADAAISKALKIEARPDWFVANAQILSMRSSEADISKSIYLLQRALSIQANHQSALLTLGFVYLRLNQFQKSIDYWELLVVELRKSGNNTQMIERQIQFSKEQLYKSLNP